MYTFYEYRLSDFTEVEKKALVESCPRRVFEFDELARTVVIAQSAECIFCRECIYTLEDFRRSPEDPLAVSIKHSTDKFTFTVETTGALTAKDVVRSALIELSGKIAMLKKRVQELDHASGGR